MYKPTLDPHWGPDDIGDLTGKVALVTGANSGIGHETAMELAAHGAHVLLGCRDLNKARWALGRIEDAAPQASVEILQIDLADQQSVRNASRRFARTHDRLDLLVNNAGVMGPPYRVTADGFELQMATNHLGPFALTGLLLGHLLTTAGSRVVTVSSHGHRLGRLRFDDLQSERHYQPAMAYCTTKLANLLFTAELDRGLAASGTDAIAVAAHPGWTASNLVANGPGIAASGLKRRSVRLASHLGQSSAAGAVPVLFAATSPAVVRGGYYGPSGPGQLFGGVSAARVSRRATDQAEAHRLWEISEELTGVRYQFAPPGAAAAG